MKFKRLLILGLVGLMVVTSTPVVSPPISVEAASTEYTVERTQIGTSNCYWALTSDGTLEITGEGDPGLNAVYPSSSQVPWFHCADSIKKVTMDSTVKPSSMAYWFYNCTNLTEVSEIPDSVTNCNSMFINCSLLIDVLDVPSSVVYCSQMFEGCANLRSVYISCNPSSYTRMFEGVGSVESPLTLYYRDSCTKSIADELATTGKNVIVKDGNNYEIPMQIGSSNCYWSITSDGVLNITGEGDPGINAHYPSCPWLIASERICKINISDSVKPISTAFWAYNCKNLVEAPEIPEGVTNCANMFSACTSLKGSITIPSSVTNCYSMFSNCTNIENVIINSNPIDYTSMFEGAGNINSKVAITVNEDCSEDIIKSLVNTGSNTYVVTCITSQPKDIQVGLSSDVIFNVRATGLDKKYQWYMADDKISEGKVLSGGVSSEYKIISSDITPELSNKYFYCVITDAYGNTTASNRAKLTIVTAPSTPSIQDKPSTPSTQDKPSTPSTPGQPSTPQTPSTPGQPSIPNENNVDNTKEISKAKKNKAKISKVINKKGKKLEIKIKKQKGYNYEIQVSTNKKFKKSTKKYTTSKNTYIVKKLKKNKKYYVRVRTYKVIDGKKVYGKWSSTKSIKIKK